MIGTGNPKKEKRLEPKAKRKNEINEWDAFNLLDSSHVVNFTKLGGVGIKKGRPMPDGPCISKQRKGLEFAQRKTVWERIVRIQTS
jgi:hypothetical protein